MLLFGYVSAVCLITLFICLTIETLDQINVTHQVTSYSLLRQLVPTDVVTVGFNVSGSTTDRPSPYSSLVDDVDILRRQEIVIWNVDLHAAPAADMKYFVEPLGVKFLQFDMSSSCLHFNTCLQPGKLKVLRDDNIQELKPSVQRSFYETYKSDPLMKSVDAFACLAMASICELYVPFNRPIIIHLALRYHDGRMKRPGLRWRSWNKLLSQLSSDRENRHVIASNNHYDAKFLEYFTGIRPTYIQAYCGYTNVTYRPTRDEFLLAKRHAFGGSKITHDYLLTEYEAVCAVRKNTTVKRATDCPPLKQIGDLFQRSYGYQDLSSYRGIVHLPYQVSTMSIFEQYRMNVPLFFPSKRLLLEWEIKFHVLSERTMPLGSRHPLTLPPHPSQTHVPSPNELDDPVAVEYWLQWADWYTLPHIYYYDSIEDMAELLSRLTQADLRKTSERMQRYNEKLKIELSEKWKQIVTNVARHRSKNL